MKTILLVILATGLLTCCAFGYELPEVIAVIEGEGYFANDFSVVPDLNGDGCDELLIYRPNIEDEIQNTYELYLGGDNFGEEPYQIFRSLGENVRIKDDCFCLPALGPEFAPIILIRLSNAVERVDYLKFYEYRNGLFELMPDYSTQREWNNDLIFPKGGPSIYPYDMNNDGWSDFVAYSKFEDHCYIYLYLGGADFDTIPDWSLSVPVRGGRIGFSRFSAGYDVNNDGYDDLIARIPDEEYFWYEIYLGGSPIDTIPACRIRSNEIAGQNGPRGLQTFSMLPDVNGDGYDDWAVYWIERTGQMDDYDGVFVFFGGEEPDWEPDLELEGHRRSLVDAGLVAGGDINGDGVGDVICSFFRGTPPTSEIHIHFGSRWMDGEADIYIDTRREYNGAYYMTGQNLGAIGDYNGDGVDDFVTQGIRKAIIFSGNRDWMVGVQKNLPTPSTFNIINAYPNPFNQTVKLTFNLNPNQMLNARIFDVNARLIDTLFVAQTGKSSYEVTWKAPESGLYFVVAETGSTKKISKILCIR